VYTICYDADRLGKTLDRVKEEVGCDRGRIEIQVFPVPIEKAVDEPMPMVPTSNNDDGGDDNEKDEMEGAEENKEESKKEGKEENKQDEVEGSAFLPSVQAAELAEDRSESQLSSELVSIYAEDEVVVTLQNTPITVDVASNDFSKGAETLKVTQTGGAEHGTCVLTSDNQVQYIPEEEFLGTDYCGYITCINFVCDEGIFAIKVTSLKTENRPTPHQSLSGFVSNYDSSGGLSLASTKKRPISEANYKEEYDGGRNLRGSGRGRLSKGKIGQ
jgi:hypothetical protein